MTSPLRSGHTEPLGDEAGKGFKTAPAVRKEEERFHLAAQAGKVFAWEWDAATGVAVLCGECAIVLGVNDGTHISDQQLLSRVHPDDRERLITVLGGLTPEQPRAQICHRIVHPDRGVVWVETSGHALFDEAGGTLRITGAVADITACKLAEMELAEAQRLARVGSWQWDPATDAVTWSDELYRISGRDPRLPAVSYKEHPQLYSPESWERLRHAVEEALRTGAPYELELEMIRTDGATRWVVARGETQHDTAGRIVSLRGTVQDITERRRSQEALRESEERLRLAAQAGRMYAYQWDRASDVITRSAEFTHILGLTCQPTVTTCKQMLTTVHPDDRAKVIAATESCTPENPTCRIQYRVLRPDGSVVWLEKNARAFFDERGAMQRMIGMVADISEQKRAEEALSGVSRKLIEAQENERARIARDLHDDIGQRLALLSVTLDRIGHFASNAGNEVLTCVDELREQIVSISACVHDLSHELHSSALRFLDVVIAMQGLCKELSRKRKVEIDFVCKDVPKNVPRDISLCLFRVAQEALHNAVKYSGVGHFEVELHGTRNRIHLTIHDSGIGFDPEAAMKGGGLGLTSMRERLKLVNGELSIDSQPRCGATIRASVPLPAPAKVQE
jgi:PAS domain S-box-containing protein